MMLTRVLVLTGACVALAPLSMAAQSSADPLASPNPSPLQSATQTQSSTTTQISPGTTRVARNTPPQDVMGETGGSGSSGDSPAQKMQDKAFLKDASEGGMAEVQFGQLAAAKGNDEKVKVFGQRMVTDHTMLNNDLKPFADKAGVTPPAGLKPADQAEFDKLNGLSGADFDKEYVAFMMKDHEIDLKDFRREAMATGDPELKATVERGETVIAKHHRWIDRIGASMGIENAASSH